MLFHWQEVEQKLFEGLLSTSRSSDFAQMNDLDPRSKFYVLASDLVGV